MSTTRRTALTALAVLVALGSLALAACSGSSSSQTKANGLIIEDAWARTSPASTGTGAVYFTVENTTDRIEKLLSASVPTAVAARAEVHEVVMTGASTDSTMAMQGMQGSTDSTMAGSGMMSMREVTSVSIPAGSTVKFEPGGYHVMLLDLAEPLKSGQKFTLSLGFMNAGVVQVEVTVRES